MVSDYEYSTMENGKVKIQPLLFADDLSLSPHSEEYLKNLEKYQKELRKINMKVNVKLWSHAESEQINKYNQVRSLKGLL